MTAVHKVLPYDGFQHDSDVLIAKVDGHLDALRAAPEPPDLALAERLAATLRELIRSTTRASAADRARVRAAVHLFVLGPPAARRNRNPSRALAVDLRVVNEVATDLGRPDLLVTPAALPA